MRLIRGMQFTPLGGILCGEVSKHLLKCRSLEPVLHIANYCGLRRTSVKALQNLGCNVIINQDYPIFRYRGQLLHENIRIEHLAVKENTKLGLEGTVIKAIHNSVNLLIGLQLLHFYCFEALEDSGISGK